MKLGFFLKGSRLPLVQSFVNCQYMVLLLISSLLGNSIVSAQTTPLSFSTIAYDEPDIVSPGRGAEQWHNASQAIRYPSEDLSHSSLDVYYRFTWNRLEGSSQGSYNWEFFDELVQSCINKGQKLSFGIMTCYPDGGGQLGVAEYDNGNSAYPEYLHRLMQSEGDKDWKSNGHGETSGYGSWVPNWNSHYYLERLRALHEAVNSHILSATYVAQSGPHDGKLVRYKDVINSIDIRGYGSWGEWHSHAIADVMSNYPAGRRPTAATLKTIIDHHVNVFQDFPLSMMISSFDAEMLPNTQTPKEVTDYILSRSNKWGKLGWRRDNWGDVGVYLDRYLRENTQSYNGSGPFNAIILERWKYAPVTGEAPGWIPSEGGCGYEDLLRQIKEYHATSLGNGNYGTSNPSDCVKDNLRIAFKAAGYRLVLEGGNISSSIQTGEPFSIQLNWKNTGVAPTYEQWNVVYELKDQGNVIWSGQSQFTPRLFLPATSAQAVTDQFILPSNIREGNYELSLSIKDPSGYRQPLPLAIHGRNDDGSYTLKSVAVTTGSPGPTVPPPVEEPACSFTTVALSATQACAGGTFHVILDDANGVGPYDVVINGKTYAGVHVGDTIFTVNDAEPTRPSVPATDESIWKTSPAPGSYEDDAVELGVQFRSSVDGFANGVRFFSPAHAGGSYEGHLWSADGELLGTAVFENVTSSSWQEAKFSSPVPVEAGQVYVVSYYTTAGRYAATPGGFSAAVSNGASLTALAHAQGGGVYKYGGPGMPTAAYNSTNYWADILFTSATAATASALAAGSSYVFTLTSATDSAGCSLWGALQTITVVPTDCGIAEQSASVQARSASVSSSTASAQLAKPGATSTEKSVTTLDQNFPNPFHDLTTITYSVGEAAQVDLSLFDMSGRLVKVLASGFKQSGRYTVHVNAGTLKPGIYFYRLRAGKYNEAKRMLIQ